MINKQEAVNQLRESLLKMVDNIENENDFNKGYRYATQHCFDIVNQIDEPEKPVVPQFVADWYEEHKNDFEYNLYKLCIDFHEQKLREDFHGWFDDDNNKSIETLVKMKLYGYEVEKGKLYTAKNKLTGTYLAYKGSSGYFHAGTGCAILKYAKYEWEALGVWDNTMYEFEEV